METEVIKIGGSILFSQTGELITENVESLIEIIKQMQCRIILVIGCGEDMHRRTIEANLTDKPQFDSNVVEALMGRRTVDFFALYRNVSDNLDRVVTLSNKYLKPIHPATAFIKRSYGSSDNPEIVWFNRDAFNDRESMLLTSGGVVLDRRILFSAISSDTIAAFLAHQFQASRLVFLTETRGIYFSMDDPQTVPLIGVDDVSDYDIIGGMKDKLRRIKSVNLGHTQIFIASGEPELANELLLQHKIDNCTKVVC